MLQLVLRSRVLAFASSSRGSLLPAPAAVQLSSVLQVDDDKQDRLFRFYTKSAAVASDDGDDGGGGGEVKVKKKKKIDPRAEDYNRRRAAYRKEVSLLRKAYFEEAVKNKLEDQAERDRKQRELARKKLERMRLRNIRSGQNALRQEEMRKEQEKKFEKHLAEVQVRREARDERYRKARQMVIDEMEKEAHLWLSTPEEIEAAFSPDAVQKLFGRPHGVLGSPNPSPDAHFWQHETHFYKMPKTYKPQRQWLLEHVEEMIFEDSNINTEYWTRERVAEAVEIEDRARLRADVQLTGRRELWKKQLQLVEQKYSVEAGEVPKVKPPPNLNFLANIKAQEDEGSRVLLEDPTIFFKFDERSGVEDENSKTSRGKYAGPTLGSPIGYKRKGENEYPVTLGKIAGPDTRTHKEKKQEEREARMMAAAREANPQMNVEMATEGGAWESLPDIDYETVREADAIAWEKSVDHNTEEGKQLLEVPDALRMTEADVEWAKEQLITQEEYYQRKMRSDIENYQAMTRSAAEFEINQIEDYVETPEDELERIVFNMPYEELMHVSTLDQQCEKSPMSDEEISEAAEQIPSLTEEQLQAILRRDRSYVPNDPRAY